MPLAKNRRRHASALTTDAQDGHIRHPPPLATMAQQANDPLHLGDGFTSRMRTWRSLQSQMPLPPSLVQDPVHPTGARRPKEQGPSLQPAKVIARSSSVLYSQSRCQRLTLITRRHHRATGACGRAWCSRAPQAQQGQQRPAWGVALRWAPAPRALTGCSAACTAPAGSTTSKRSAKPVYHLWVVVTCHLQPNMRLQYLTCFPVCREP